MRPIWIKIKGLNSFLEPQEIDFQELTGEGLFGIFGPTGSGKSSILDGITLALYGAGRLYFFCKDKGNPYLPGDQRI